MMNIEKFVKKQKIDKIDYVKFVTTKAWILVLKYSKFDEIPNIHNFKLPRVIKGVLIDDTEFYFTWKFSDIEYVCKLILNDKNKKELTRTD